MALPREREIDRTLERFSDGEVTAPVRGKLIVDLEPPEAGRARILGQAIRNAGGRYACPALLAQAGLSPAEARLVDALARVAAEARRPSASPTHRIIQARLMAQPAATSLAKCTCTGRGSGRWRASAAASQAACAR